MLRPSITALLLAACLAAALGACATPADPAGQVRARAWGQVLGQTEVARIDSQTLRAQASTPLFRAGDDMEIALLTRVAGEAVRLGAPRFAITFVEYDEVSLLGGGYTAPDAGWIGSYSDLLEARARADYDGSLGGGVGFEDMTAVVRLLADGEAPDREAFVSADVYETLLAARIDGQDLRPRRRLRLPRIRFE